MTKQFKEGDKVTTKYYDGSPNMVYTVKKSTIIRGIEWCVIDKGDKTVEWMAHQIQMAPQGVSHV